MEVRDGYIYINMPKVEALDLIKFYPKIPITSITDKTTISVKLRKNKPAYKNILEALRKLYEDMDNSVAYFEVENDKEVNVFIVVEDEKEYRRILGWLIKNTKITRVIHVD